MIRTFALAALLGATLFACGGETVESLQQQTLDAYKDLGNMLAEIKDSDSAEAAKAKMVAVAEQLKDLRHRSEKLAKKLAAEGKLDLDALAEGFAEKTGDFMAAGMKVQGELTRITSDPKLRDELQDVTERLRELMRD